jgi:alpha-ribazole phosphatase
MTLWLVRHAQPLIHAGICYGALDIPADLQATQECATTLVKVLPVNALVISSLLQRCEQLSEQIRGQRADLTFKTDARLAEMNFGTWEGQAWKTIARAELDAWTNQFATWRCGGAQGESVNQFMARVGSVWDECSRRQTPTVWITHGGVIRAASLLARGVRHVQMAADWPINAPSFGQWVCLEPPDQSNRAPL